MRGRFIKSTIILVVLLSSVWLTITGCSAAGGGGGGASLPTVIDGTIEYPAISLVRGTAKIFTPQIVESTHSSQTVIYSITPDLPGTGFSFDTSNGAIAVATAAASISRTYTVTATGTGNYIGSISAQVPIHIAGTAIDGTLSYANTAVITGETATISPSWMVSGSDSRTNTNQTVRYELEASAPSWLTINSSGDISIATDATVTNATDYRISVVGIGNFAGVVEATIRITVGDKYPLDGTLAYDDFVNVKAGATKTITPSITGNSRANPTVVYSISDTDGAAVVLPTGITFDTATGKIVVATTATQQAKTYIVTATATGDFRGTLTISVPINIASAAATAITGTLTFADLVLRTGTSGEVTGTWASVTDSNQTVIYSIDSGSTGISIDATGKVTVPIGATTNVSSQTYNVTVLGTGALYIGKVTSTVKVIVQAPEEPEVVSYNGTTTSAGAVFFGPHIKDTTFADTTIATISGLYEGSSYTFKLGNKTVTKTANNAGKIVILKSEVSSTNATDGAKALFTGGWITSDVEVGVFKTHEIRSWKDLQAMRVDLAGDYTLINDITFPSAGNDNLPNTGFVPIGNSTTAFTGTFDGNNKKIIGFLINKTTSATYSGLFGKIIGAAASTKVVKNLTMEDPSITGGAITGAIVGYITKGTIENVTIQASTSAGSGVKIDVGEPGTICGTSGSVVGGIVGAACGTLTDKVSIIKSANIGVPVSGTNGDMGGLIGVLQYGKVVGYSTGNVKIKRNTSGNNQDIGGLVGNAATEIEIIGYSTGDVEYVSGTSVLVQYVGGLVGHVSILNKTSKIIGYYTGDIKGTVQYSRSGGLVGSIDNPTPTAALSAGEAILDIIGYTSKTAKIKGFNFIGGIIGQVAADANELHIQIYNRSILDLSNIAGGGFGSFGRLIGDWNSTKWTYGVGFYSRVDSLYDTGSGSTSTAPAGQKSFGTREIEIADITAAAPTDFEPTGKAFAFGTGVGEWVYATGKWPALNLGSEMPDSAASTQPVDP